MKLAFYLASSGTLTDKLIAAYTFGPYSHVEMVFDDSARALIPAGMVHAGDPGGALCYSSTWAAPRDGCGFIDIALGSAWRTVDVPAVTPEQERAMVQMAIHDNGKPYDWAGIWGFVFPPVPDDRAERFCSEECTRLLERAGYLKRVEAVRTSPNRLARLIEKQGRIL